MRKILILILLSTSVASAETIFELVERNRVEQVQEQLEAHPEWIDRTLHDVTLLHVASFQGSQRMVELLLERGAELDAPDMMGSTPLHRAFANGYGDLGLFLLERGAGLNRANRVGETPFMMAAGAVELPAFKALLKRRDLELEKADNRGWTALHHSVERERWENLRALLGAGADVNHQDKKGRTLLHKAVAAGQPELAETVLEAGVNPDLKDERGRTALQIALERRDRRMTDLLREL